MSEVKRALAVVLLVVCAALLLYPLLTKRTAMDVYQASGRAMTFPEVGMPGGTVAVNAADLYELTELPGIGETIGQAILDERERRGYFYYPEDLISVRGIGGKTLENIRELLDMSQPTEKDGRTGE